MLPAGAWHGSFAIQVRQEVVGIGDAVSVLVDIAEADKLDARDFWKDAVYLKVERRERAIKHPPNLKERRWCMQELALEYQWVCRSMSSMLLQLL